MALGRVGSGERGAPGQVRRCTCSSPGAVPSLRDSRCRPVRPRGCGVLAHQDIHALPVVTVCGASRTRPESVRDCPRCWTGVGRVQVQVAQVPGEGACVLGAAVPGGVLAEGCRAAEQRAVLGRMPDVFVVVLPSRGGEGNVRWSRVGAHFPWNQCRISDNCFPE
jgi:hypothetical protein